jgi:hypothetical protein
MQDDNMLGWVGLVIAFIIFQIVRGVLRGAKSDGASTGGTKGGDGMARLNAAAERILKARGATVADPTPRKPQTGKMPARTTQAGKAPTRAKAPAALPRSTSPAVIRRDGLLGGREPVIQRRR